MTSHLSTHEVFNQSPPFSDINLYDSDPVLKSIVKAVSKNRDPAKLREFGALTGSRDALEIGRLANENPPKLRSFDSKGHRLDFVEYHPAYHRAMEISMAQGLHCSPWSYLSTGGKPNANGHLLRAAGSYMAVQMEPGHCCPITMTHASLATLKNHNFLLADWLPKILDRSYDPQFAPMVDKSSATIGMGMTEKQGGTDVRSNSSRAVPADKTGEGEIYQLTGHKWFVSAPMSDAFLMLAQAAAGLSCFFVPRFLPDGNVNSLQIQRLKDKLGNRSNASSEMEFEGALGWLVGEEGKGLRTIIDMVTFTRLDCAVSSAALMRFALANAIHHARYRTVFQKKLIDQPLMECVLTDLVLDWEAATRLAFRLARAFDRPDDEAETAFRRVMTPVIKYWVCKIAPAFVYEAMECLGGNGYVEEGPLARTYREVPVNAIWEGSGNVMCLDFLRVLLREKDTAERFFASLRKDCEVDPRLQRALSDLLSLLSNDRAGAAADQYSIRLETQARSIVERLALITAGTLMRQFATEDVANAFLGSRISGNWRHTYGAGLADITGFGRADFSQILERAFHH